MPGLVVQDKEEVDDDSGNRRSVVLLTFWNCYFPMSPYVRPLVGLSVCRSVYHYSTTCIFYRNYLSSLAPNNILINFIPYSSIFFLLKKLYLFSRYSNLLDLPMVNLNDSVITIPEQAFQQSYGRQHQG